MLDNPLARRGRGLIEKAPRASGGLRLAIILAVTLSCGESPGATQPTPNEPSDRAVSRVSLTQLLSHLFVGGTSKLSPQTEFVGGSSETGLAGNYTWTTSDPAVLSVDDFGVVTAIGPGTAIVHATRGGVSDSVSFSVNPRATHDVALPGVPGLAPQEEPFVALGPGGEPTAVWKIGDDSGWRWVVASRSIDGGASWTTPVRFHLGGPEGPDSFQSDPWIAAGPGGVMYRAHVERPAQFDGDNTQILVSRSHNGLDWDQPVNVDDLDGFADKPSVVVGPSGNVYVAYLNCEGACEIVVARSLDDGTTWQTRVVGENGASPVVAVAADGTVYCAYWDITISASSSDGNVRLTASRDAGSSWGTPTRVNPADLSVPYLRVPISQRPATPSIVVGPGGEVLLAWPGRAPGVTPRTKAEAEEWDIWLSRSVDGGATWTETRVNDVRAGDQWMPTLALGPDGVLHAAWYDSREGDATVAYASSSDRGDTWTPNVALGSAGWEDVSLRVGDYLGITAGSNGEAHVVWTDRQLPGVLGIRVRYAKMPHF